MTVLVMLSGPRLRRVTENTTCCPVWTLVELLVLVTCRSAIGKVLVTTVEDELLARFVSVTPAGTPTVAVFVNTPLVMARTVI
jgi:hypothetical protein